MPLRLATAHAAVPFARRRGYIWQALAMPTIPLRNVVLRR